MKISQALDKIDEKQLFVPAFQREYVWKRDDAKQLVDSLIKEYPTGTMLTWETNTPPELKGPHKYDEKQGAVRILLDGQQRLTTLYMLIRGDMPPYYTAPEILNDTRGLYVNVETRELEYYKKAQDGERSALAKYDRYFPAQGPGQGCCSRLGRQGRGASRVSATT